MNIPLSIMIEQTRMKMVQGVNQVIEDSHLPAFLIEGILVEILAEVRKQKNIELTSDYATMQNISEEQKGELDNGKH